MSTPLTDELRQALAGEVAERRAALNAIAGIFAGVHRELILAAGQLALTVAQCQVLDMEPGPAPETANEATLFNTALALVASCGERPMRPPSQHLVTELWTAAICYGKEE